MPLTEGQNQAPRGDYASEEEREAAVSGEILESVENAKNLEEIADKICGLEDFVGVPENQKKIRDAAVKKIIELGLADESNVEQVLAEGVKQSNEKFKKLATERIDDMEI